MAGTIEYKVQSATVGALGGTAVANFGLWLLETYTFHGPVPGPVATLVQYAVPTIATFVAGYVAKHTPRADLQVDPVDVAEAVHTGDNPVDSPTVGISAVDKPGRHADDGEPGDIPASRFPRPSATRPALPRRDIQR